MELASLLADEPFSDSPASVCPALREFLQSYNDGLPDHLRQELYALASDVVGTRGPARITAWRGRLCVAWGGSQALLENVSTSFGRWTLANCALAGSYSARAARRNRWCHRQTLAFLTWLAHARSPLAACRTFPDRDVFLPLSSGRPAAETGSSATPMARPRVTV